jgi:hypothetical protein
MKDAPANPIRKRQSLTLWMTALVLILGGTLGAVFVQTSVGKAQAGAFCTTAGCNLAVRCFGTPIPPSDNGQATPTMTPTIPTATDTTTTPAASPASVTLPRCALCPLGITSDTSTPTIATDGVTPTATPATPDADAVPPGCMLCPPGAISPAATPTMTTDGTILPTSDVGTLPPPFMPPIIYATPTLTPATTTTPDADTSVMLPNCQLCPAGMTSPTTTPTPNTMGIDTPTATTDTSSSLPAMCSPCPLTATGQSATPTATDTGALPSACTPCSTATATADANPTGAADTPAAMDAGAGSPYGITTIHADGTLVSQLHQLNICWTRLQMDETSIQPSPGVFNWSGLDQAVATLNAAGIHIDFPLRCFGGACFSNPTLPTPAQMAAYATAVASRYDGRHGHGRIDAFEVGNEEYDFFSPGVYGPILQAGYLAIKSVYPDALVGMYGTYRPSLQHLQAVMSAIANGYSQYLDFANFHYYVHGDNPSISQGDIPSLNQAIQAIHAILPNKPIWLTEVGWPTSPLPGISAVSPAVQAEYLRYVMDTAASSGIVQRVFWFTLDYGNQPDSIYPQNGGPLPAFTLLQQYVQQYPLWTASASSVVSSSSGNMSSGAPQPMPTVVPMPVNLPPPSVNDNGNVPSLGPMP